MGRIAVPNAAEFPGSADVVIIGGGVVGCATAFFASKAGLETIVLESKDGLGTMTTAASEECFRAQFDEPENINMMLESIATFEDFADVVQVADCDINIHQQGYLFLTTHEQGRELLSTRVQRQRSFGLSDVEFLDGGEVQQRFPFVGPTVLAATFRAKDGWLSAHELTYGFAKGSTALFALRTPATAFRLDAHGVAGVATSRGGISTRCVVVAAGPFTKEVLSWAGVVDMPMTCLRRQKVILADVPQVPPEAPMTIDQDTGAFWRPEVGGAALGWALPEEPSQPTERVPTDWTFPAVVLDGVSRLTPFWDDVAPMLTRDKVFLSAGQYTCTPDHKPVIGPCSEVPGLYVSGGYSGHGIMASPAAARLMVRLILDSTAIAENPFRCDRFAEQDLSVCAESMVL
jgi:sarcosine oxidase subunit beta